MTQTDDTFDLPEFCPLEILAQEHRRSAGYCHLAYICPDPCVPLNRVPSPEKESKCIQLHSPS